MDITSDPRFIRGVELFNDGEYLEASDYFEELFFEGVRDEPEFIRIFLQFSVGIYHAQVGQWRPAVERIEEGVRVAGSIRDARGFDISGLAAAMKTAAVEIRNKLAPTWPRIESTPSS